MNSKNLKKFENQKINVKVKLALFWVTLMFLYIYNDILSMYQPGHVAELVGGTLEGMTFSQAILVASAILMSFPSLIVILTLSLKARTGRIVNIVFGIFHILILISTQFVGENKPWIYWRINEILEGLIILLIIWTAWKWPLKSQNIESN